MYPQLELTRLAAHKVALRRDIAVRRVQCVEAAARVVQPLEWLDRVLVFWRRLSPLAQFMALPLGIFLKRKVFPRSKILGLFVRWTPIFFTTMHGIRSAVNSHFENSNSSNHRS
jgi:hypothetical protein